ncbi:Diaminopimelate decarboxylase [metagenome]|uniref:Diaminopimelate decarboxylase n=1 Tax=metagenome TaxID=256318 RepID=A0A2P2C2I5_9ZZZZ
MRGSVSDAAGPFLEGVSPITGRLVAWQEAALADPAMLSALLDEHGSPVNLIDPDPLPAHAEELVGAAAGLGVELRVFFARKANKSIAVAETALAAGRGVDVSSERELTQLLDRGADPARLILTAAIKPPRLLELALERGVVVSIDNHDELDAVHRLAGGRRAAVALRLSAPVGLAPSRFGFTGVEAAALVDDPAVWSDLTLVGVHFHLHGYAAADRAVALDAALDLVEHARARGLSPAFVDIGGGIPMTYVDDPGPWDEFWRAHTAALLGQGPSVTWADHALGRVVAGDEVTGAPAVYPLWQQPIRGDWLRELLRSPSQAGGTVAERTTRLGVRLQAEPGRALLDGCGLTVARVAFRKRSADGDWLIGLEMNRTQCRSAALDFLLDPVLIPTGSSRSAPGEGFLVGAYCIEAELLTWRRLRFPHGVAVGDLVVFVNTAGYQMHILESASHQIPLARNLVPGADGWELDPIDLV